MVLEKLILCTLLISIAPAIALNTQRPCQKRETKYGYVCVCDVNYCDTLDVPEPKINEYILTTSSMAGDRFSYVRGGLTHNNSASDLHLEIDTLKRYQKINGFGGGYTGSVANLIDQISSKLQNHFYESYFSKTVGMGYSYLRIPIGGSDMDLKIWAYNERPVNDTNLSNFTKLDPRDLTRNAQLKRMAQVSKNSNVKLLAGAWTPPPWMKAKGNSWMASVNNQILPKYYQTWANYHVKWLDLMKKDSMNIWAISTGNEPQSSKTNLQFPETYWDVDKHAKWIGENLGPTMKNSIFSHIEIHGLDDNRVYAIDWLDKLQKTNKKALDYLSAIDIHGYSDKTTSPEILDELRRKYPAKEIYYTEMCFGIPGYAVLGSWQRGASLAKILMQNLNHSTNGYDSYIILNSFMISMIFFYFQIFKHIFLLNHLVVNFFYFVF